MEQPFTHDDPRIISSSSRQDRPRYATAQGLANDPYWHLDSCPLMDGVCSWCRFSGVSLKPMSTHAMSQGTVYIVTSSTLISFNKFLMQPGRPDFLPVSFEVAIYRFEMIGHLTIGT